MAQIALLLGLVTLLTATYVSNAQLGVNGGGTQFGTPGGFSLLPAQAPPTPPPTPNLLNWFMYRQLFDNNWLAALMSSNSFGGGGGVGGMGNMFLPMWAAAGGF